MEKKTEGFEKIRIEKDDEVGFKPVENCRRLYDLGKYVSKYILVIGKVTENSFDVIKQELCAIYDGIYQDGDHNQNMLAFSWQISQDASKVRNVKWDFEVRNDFDNLTQAKFENSDIPTGNDEIVKWLLKSEALNKAMKERLINMQKEFKEWKQNLKPEKRITS